MKDLLLALIPVFVAVDPIGVLPVYISLTSEMTTPQKRRVIVQSMLTAAGLAIGFLFLGRAVFALLGITVGDFLVAGGAILFCIAIMDIVTSERERRRPGGELGVVPLGTPLVAGPALLTTTLLVVEQHGLPATLAAVVINLLLTGSLFWASGWVLALLGEPGTRALSKLTNLLLAAIAVMMVRRGLTMVLA
jgi:multiple antibiotic resistance protein